jgi:hypothetical protein
VRHRHAEELPHSRHRLRCALLQLVAVQYQHLVLYTAHTRTSRRCDSAICVHDHGIDSMRSAGQARRLYTVGTLSHRQCAHRRTDGNDLSMRTSWG